MTYEEKSAIVIKQLREDRDRLLDAFNNVRAEIENSAFDDVNGSKFISVNRVNQILDKYKVEIGEMAMNKAEDVELVIKMPKKLYEHIKNDNEYYLEDGETLYTIVENGTPLPKRMLSVDLIIKTLCTKDEDYDYPCITPSYLEEELERLLLEADKWVNFAEELKDVFEEEEEVEK